MAALGELTMSALEGPAMAIFRKPIPNVFFQGFGQLSLNGQ
jgi:hypothetical protein